MTSNRFFYYNSIKNTNQKVIPKKTCRARQVLSPISVRWAKIRKLSFKNSWTEWKWIWRTFCFVFFLFVWLGGYFWLYIYIYIFGLCLRFYRKPAKTPYNDCCVLGTPRVLGTPKKAWENYQRKPWQNDGTDHFPFRMIPQKRGEVLNFRGVKLLVEQLQSC